MRNPVERFEMSLEGDRHRPAALLRHPGPSAADPAEEGSRSSLSGWMVLLMVLLGAVLGYALSTLV